MTPSNLIVLHAPTWEIARVLRPDITVEAEYGDHVATGRLYTAAHHQPRGPFAGRHIVEGGRPSPCNDTDIPVLEDGGMILLSHLDLDSVGGTLRAVPGTADLFSESTFWQLAEYADTHAPHLFHRCSFRDEDVTRFWAYHEWLRHHPRLPMDVASLVHVEVSASRKVLEGILSGDPALLEMGEKLKAHDAEMTVSSFVFASDGVILRHYDNPSDFVNHLYLDPRGNEHAAIVAWNRTTGSVTVSLSEPSKHPGVNCRDIVQSLWGPAAGGHPGCAGGPRGVRLGFGEADRAVRTMQELLRA